jgi:hypothetical protein
MLTAGDPVMIFSGEEKLLYIHADRKMSDTIGITILNSRTEVVMRMQLISGSHRIDLSSLQEEAYAVKLEAGSNVWLQKIDIHH